jgi:ribosomal protein S18 acetylase RimI-like enzyme
MVKFRSLLYFTPTTITITLSMSFTISKAEPSDADNLAILVNSAYRGESSRQGWTTEADLLDGSRTAPELLSEVLNRKDTTVLKYTEDGKILGCVELKRTGTKLYLGMLTVSPALQGKGIGKLLLKVAEDHANQTRCSAIYMTVISIRKELIDWYKRHGYSETGEWKPFHFSDERWGIPKQELEFIVLEKKLG